MGSLIILSGFFSRVYYGFLNHFAGSYTRRILLEAVDLLGKLWPYLAVGILLTTLVKLYISKVRLANFLSEKAAATSILLAALLGAASPLGSYVVIPLSAALLTVGVPLPPLMALMVSSPLINPSLFLLTMGAMGLEMALARTVSAILLGITAGILTRWVLAKRETWLAVPLKDSLTFSMGSFTAGSQDRDLKTFLKELYRMTRYVSWYFFLAILLAAAIKILVNPRFIMQHFAGNDFLGVLLTTAAGVPFYVCGGAAIPVVQSLAELGMSKGAALAFFISGPVTKASNLVILGSAFKSRLLFLYLAIGIGGALVFGLLYNLFP
jgi:uncharacterized membrane protein YraQ (UPF0718 family)